MTKLTFLKKNLRRRLKGGKRNTHVKVQVVY